MEDAKNKESCFNIKLIENNDLIGKLFNGDKFPLLLEVNENKELSNLIALFFLDNKIAISFVHFEYLCFYSW